ncbi:hydroxyethylthiazole kinase [Nakamurella sp. PAMC28650]|uniref:hydroxyethylthiazole kinase n=1 Tax=Nakamurella sp. PAMC28650 TaxID=2762325 RepID=UPI00164D23F2|nr:hydroxyethylthiazole kinase [Nakamurella sp. PAMC28650]QNK82449.1 hydroxyethylthiazole kinase [Nakamurella sp. PAMC28650]
MKDSSTTTTTTTTTTPPATDDGPVTSESVTVGAVIDAVRAGSPLVHCVTNTVVANFTANALLAAGAAPAMVDAPEESGVLASVAGALLINLGTVTSAQADGMRAAIRGANAAGVPWVLDPVAIGALPMRTGLAREFAALGPAVIRGNASEIGALAGGAGGRGVDSTADVADVALVAAEIAREFGTVVAISGAVDLITDGTRTARVSSGTAMLTRVTGVGCSLGALIAACAAVTSDVLMAAAAATSWVCVAGEEATAASKGAGSFAVGFIDALDLLSANEIAVRSGVSIS